MHVTKGKKPGRKVSVPWDSDYMTSQQRQNHRDKGEVLVPGLGGEAARAGELEAF